MDLEELVPVQILLTSVRAWFKVSAATWIKTVLFWVITQHVVVIPFRRFVTNFRSRNFGKELSLLADK
jgi:hypothetical protein